MIRRRSYANNVKTAQIARMHQCIDASIFTVPLEKDQPMYLNDVTVAYHRNGVSGMGFYVLTFTWRESRRGPGRRMVATVFEERGQLAVLDIDALTQDNIAFAQGNSWRGDEFEAALREHITAYGERSI